MAQRFCYGRISATPGEQNSALYNIACYKRDTIAKELESFPPNLTFMRHLLGPRPTSCQALFQRLALVQLSPKTDEFR
jgi:hypothetical protein